MIKLLRTHKLAVKGRCLQICKIGVFSKDDSFLFENSRKFITFERFYTIVKFPKYDQQRYREVIFFDGLLWEGEGFFGELFVEQSLFADLRTKVKNFKLIRRYRKFRFRRFFRAVLRMLLVFLENTIVNSIDMLNSRFLLFVYFLTKLNSLEKSSDWVVRKKKNILRNFFFVYLFFLGRLNYLQALDSEVILKTGRFARRYKEISKSRLRRLHLVLYSPFKVSSVNNFRYFLMSKREEWDARVGILLKKISFFQKRDFRIRKKSENLFVASDTTCISSQKYNYKKRAIANCYKNFFVLKQSTSCMSTPSFFFRKKVHSGVNVGSKRILRKGFSKTDCKRMSLGRKERNYERSFFRAKNGRNSFFMFLGGLRSFFGFFDRFSFSLIIPMIHRMFWLKRFITVLDDKRKLLPKHLIRRWRRFFYQRLKRKFFEFPNRLTKENFIFGENLAYVLGSFFQVYKKMGERKRLRFFKFGNPIQDVLTLNNYFKFWRRKRQYFTSIFLKKLPKNPLESVEGLLNYEESEEDFFKELITPKINLFVNVLNFPLLQYAQRRLKGAETRNLFWYNLVCYVGRKQSLWFQNLFSRRFGLFFVQNSLTWLQNAASCEPLIPQWGGAFLKILANYFYFYFMLCATIIRTEILKFDIDEFLEDFRDLPVFLHYPLAKEGVPVLRSFRAVVNKSRIFSELLDLIAIDLKDGANKRFFYKLIPSFISSYLAVEPKAPYVELDLVKKTIKQSESFDLMTNDIMEGMLRVGYPPRYALALLAEMLAFQPYVEFLDLHDLEKPKLPLGEIYIDPQFRQYPYKFSWLSSRLELQRSLFARDRVELLLKIKRGVNPFGFARRLVRRNRGPFFDATHKKMQWLTLRYIRFSLKDKVERRWLKRKRSVHTYFFKRYLKTCGVFHNIYKTGMKINFFGFFHRAYDIFFTSKRAKFFVVENNLEEDVSENVPKPVSEELITRISFCSLSAIAKHCVANFTSILFGSLKVSNIKLFGHWIKKVLLYSAEGTFSQERLIFDFYTRNWLINFKNSRVLSVLHFKNVQTFLKCKTDTLTVMDYWHILLFLLRRVGFKLPLFCFAEIFLEFKTSAAFFFILKNRFLIFKRWYSRGLFRFRSVLRTPKIQEIPGLEGLLWESIETNSRSIKSFFFSKIPTRHFQTFAKKQKRNFDLRFRKYKFNFFHGNFFYRFFIAPINVITIFFGFPRSCSSGVGAQLQSLDVMINYFEFSDYENLLYQFFRRNYFFLAHVCTAGDFFNNNFMCVNGFGFDFSSFFQYYPTNLLYYYLINSKYKRNDFLLPINRQNGGWIIPGFYSFFNFSMRDFFFGVNKIRLGMRNLKRKNYRRNFEFFMNFNKRLLSRVDLKNIKSVKLDRVPFFWFNKLKKKTKVDFEQSNIRWSTLSFYRPFQREMIKNEDPTSFRDFSNSSSLFNFKFSRVNFLMKGQPEKFFGQYKDKNAPQTLGTSRLARILHLNRSKYEKKKRAAIRVPERRLKSDFSKFDAISRIFNNKIIRSFPFKITRSCYKTNINYSKLLFFKSAVLINKKILSRNRVSHFFVTWLKDSLKGSSFFKPLVRRISLRHSLRKNMRGQVIKYLGRQELPYLGVHREKDVFDIKFLGDVRRKSQNLFNINLIIRKYVKILFYINYQVIVLNGHLSDFLRVEMLNIRVAYEVFNYFNSFKCFYSFFPIDMGRHKNVLKNIYTAFELLSGSSMISKNPLKYARVKSFSSVNLLSKVHSDFMLICSFLHGWINSSLFFSVFSFYSKKSGSSAFRCGSVWTFPKSHVPLGLQFLRFYVFVQNVLIHRRSLISLKYLLKFFSKSFLFSLKKKNFFDIKSLRWERVVGPSKFLKKGSKKQYIVKRNFMAVVFKPSFFIFFNEYLSAIVYQLLAFSPKKIRNQNQDFPLFDFQRLLSFFVGLFTKNIVQFFRFYHDNNIPNSVSGFNFVISSLMNGIFNKTNASLIKLKVGLLKKVLFFFSYSILDRVGKGSLEGGLSGRKSFRKKGITRTQTFLDFRARASSDFKNSLSGVKNFLNLYYKNKSNLKWKLLFMRGSLRIGLRKLNQIVEFAKSRKWYSMKFLYKRVSFRHLAAYRFKERNRPINFPFFLRVNAAKNFPCRQIGDLLKVKDVLGLRFFTKEDPLSASLGEYTTTLDLATERRSLRQRGVKSMLEKINSDKAALIVNRLDQKMGYHKGIIPSYKTLHIFKDKLKFPLVLHKGFDEWATTEWYNKYYHTFHFSLWRKLHPYMKRKIFLGPFLSPKFFSLENIPKSSFFFSNFELNIKMKKKVSVFLKLVRFLEYLVKVSLKVRLTLKENLKTKGFSFMGRDIISEFFSDSIFSFLFIVYRKAKVMLRTFLEGIFLEAKEVLRSGVLGADPRSYFYKIMVNFYSNRVHFGFFYNLMSVFFLKFFILRCFFFGDYMRLRLQFANRFFWFRFVPLIAYFRSPKFFFIITKFRNNFFLSAIDRRGKLYYKCSPGMLGYTGTDRVSKYAWFDTSVRFFDGFITFLFRAFYLKRARKRRVMRSRGVKEREKIKIIADATRKVRIRRELRRSARDFFFRLRPSTVFFRYIDPKKLAWWQKEAQVRESNKSMREQAFRKKRRERVLLGFYGFFIIAKGISNFDLRVFRRGIFSEKHYRYKYRKLYFGAIKYPKCSFSLCRVKKVRRV